MVQHWPIFHLRFINSFWTGYAIMSASLIWNLNGIILFHLSLHLWLLCFLTSSVLPHPWLSVCLKLDDGATSRSANSYSWATIQMFCVQCEVSYMTERTFCVHSCVCTDISVIAHIIMHNTRPLMLNLIVCWVKSVSWHLSNTKYNLYSISGIDNLVLLS